MLYAVTGSGDRGDWMSTGGTGFLGQHLVKQLTAQGDARVRVVARRAPKGPAHQQQQQVEYIEASILDRSALQAAFDGVDGVFHLAGLVEHSKRRAAQVREVNVHGTLNALEAAAEQQVPRVVMASTSGVAAVSDRSDAAPASDGSPYARAVTAQWPYYSSKIEAEERGLARAKELGLDLVCMRPTLLLGPGDARLSSCRSVHDLLNRKVPFLPGGGLSFVDVRDTAAAFRAAMQQGTPYSTYLLGATNLTVQEFFQKVEQLSGVPTPKLRVPGVAAKLGAQIISRLLSLAGRYNPTMDPVMVEMSQVFWYLDSSTAQADLGFQPRNADDTLQDTIDWLLANQDALRLV